MKLAKLANRTLFVLSVVVTGSVAGAFVWALLFVMNLGISFVWDNVGGRFGIYFPLAACLVGGLRRRPLRQALRTLPRGPGRRSWRR